MTLVTFFHNPTDYLRVDIFTGFSVFCYGLEARLNLSKESLFMSVTSPTQSFRGVLCRHCGKPVRIPDIVLRKDNEAHGKPQTDEAQFQLISRVFVLRCRSCERESIYSISQIVDCLLPQTHSHGHANAAAL